MGHRRSSTGDFALGGSERLFSSGQREPIKIIRGRRCSSGESARHVNLPTSGSDLFLGCPISEGVYLNKAKCQLGSGAIWVGKLLQPPPRTCISASQQLSICPDRHGPVVR